MNGDEKQPVQEVPSEISQRATFIKPDEVKAASKVRQALNRTQAAAVQERAEAAGGQANAERTFSDDDTQARSHLRRPSTTAIREAEDAIE